MAVCSPSLAPDICPTADDLIGKYLMLIPRGRAWGEGGVGRTSSGIIYGFLYFCAIVMAAYHAAICSLIPEFFCFSADVTSDYWLSEYGLPDPCDPFPDPCSKIIASGGPTCENLIALAALTGVAIECGPGPQPASVLITVHLPSPPPTSGPLHAQNMRMTGGYYAGEYIDCGAEANPLDCLLQRVVHAHVTIFYQYVYP